jgi:hypothetical protein
MSNAHTGGKAMTYTPVKVTTLGNIAEHAPVCGMTLDAAIKYAKEAYGEDAGVACDDEQYLARDIYWVYGEPETA